jgi:amphi-Trp domain-containing protein
MGKEVKLFKSEERQSRSAVAQFLRDIAEKVDAGQVILSRGKEEITLNIPANVILEIQVEDEDKKRKGIEHSLEIEITWFDSDDFGGPLKLG